MNGWEQTENGRLAFRWAEDWEPIPEKPSWLLEEPVNCDPLPSLPEFAAHSPLGSGEWFVPWDARWSVSGR